MSSPFARGSTPRSGRRRAEAAAARSRRARRRRGARRDGGALKRGQEPDTQKWHMNSRSTRLPWYGQIGAFVALALGMVLARSGTSTSSPRRRALRPSGPSWPTLRDDHQPRRWPPPKRLPEFRSEVADEQAQLDRLRAVLPEERDVADLLRRVQAMATQSNLTIQGFYAAGDRDARAPRRVADRPAARGHVSRPWRVSRAGQQVPTHHQRQRNHDPGQRNETPAAADDHRRAHGDDVRPDRPEAGSARGGRPRARARRRGRGRGAAARGRGWADAARASPSRSSIVMLLGASSPAEAQAAAATGAIAPRSLPRRRRASPGKPPAGGRCNRPASPSGDSARAGGIPPPAHRLLRRSRPTTDRCSSRPALPTTPKGAAIRSSACCGAAAAHGRGAEPRVRPASPASRRRSHAAGNGAQPRGLRRHPPGRRSEDLHRSRGRQAARRHGADNLAERHGDPAASQRSALAREAARGAQGAPTGRGELDMYRYTTLIVLCVAMTVGAARSPPAAPASRRNAQEDCVPRRCPCRGDRDRSLRSGAVRRLPARSADSSSSSCATSSPPGSPTTSSPIRGIPFSAVQVESSAGASGASVARVTWRSRSRCARASAAHATSFTSRRIGSIVRGQPTQRDANGSNPSSASATCPRRAPRRRRRR